MTRTQLWLLVQFIAIGVGIWLGVAITEAVAG